MTAAGSRQWRYNPKMDQFILRPAANGKAAGHQAHSTKTAKTETTAASKLKKRQLSTPADNSIILHRHHHLHVHLHSILYVKID